ncbi:Uncharacterised protein [Mycobacteroides abscessus subsp. abscessus]|nr:Uncharacterised protein [Mycobacteroides abscessus subsp. abscessus]
MLSRRRIIPNSTVQTHTAMPVGVIEVGRDQPRLSTHPIAPPDRNGQAVCHTPSSVMPSAWLRRPMVQNTKMPTTSSTSASSTDVAGFFVSEFGCALGIPRP